MATPYQSIDPALLALQTAKKAMPASPSTQQKKKPVLQSNIQQSQAPFATSPVAPAKIGGISSPFGATNINSSPILGGATPQEIGTTATQLQSLPKAMPDTGATPPDMTQSLKDLKATIPSMQSIDDIKGAFPEFSNLDDSVLLDLVETTKNSDNYEDILSVFPELQGGGLQLQGGGKAQFSPGGIEQFKPVMPTTPGFINPLKTLVNAPGSFANVGINYANMGLSPKETVKGLLKTIVGATNVVGSAIPKFVLGDEKYNEVNQKLLNDQGTLGQIRRYATEGGEQAKAVGEYFKGYGDLEELQRRIEEDPAGILSDVATLMGFAGGAIQKVGQVSKLSKVSQVGQKIASLEKYDPYRFVPKATKEIGGKAISKVANIAGEGAVSLLGKATGTSADTIKEVYKAAAQGDTSAIEGIRGAINDEAVIENLKRGVQDIIDDRKTMYGKGYEVLKSNLTNVDTTPIAKKTLESLSDMGINFDAQGNLDFAGSTITSPQARSNLQNIVSDLYTRGDNTPKGLDILKQRVADYARYTPEFAKSDRIATMVSNLIKDEIVKVVPEYAEMTKGYSELSNLVKDIKQATGMGRKENISTIGTKLKGLLRDNQEVRKMVVQKMQEATGRNVLGQVAGLQMQPIMPRGLMGVGIAGGVALGQISSLINPTYLIPLLATSPRLIGEIANAMGVSTKFVTDYYNKFKSYASKYGNNTTDIMNNGGIMGNGLPNRADEVRVPPSSPGGNIAPVNNTPVIPPKATIAPSVSAPKVDTFARMTELDTNPLYRKLGGGEVLGGGKIKQGLFETPLGTITNEIMDGKVKKYVVNGKTYNLSDLGGIREKQAPEVVAQANKVSKAISDLKAIESGKGNTMGSSLRSVLDDLGIKDVNSIPEGTEQDILQMVRARKPVAPKKGMPKLGKETLEQDIAQGDDLIQEAKKYKTADEFIKAQSKIGEASDSPLKYKEVIDLVDNEGTDLRPYLASNVEKNNPTRFEKMFTKYNNGNAPKDGKVEIYRVSVGDKINPGDWVTNSLEYANNHKDRILSNRGERGGAKISKMIVGIDELLDPQYGVGPVLENEFFYAPKDIRGKDLKQIREQANKKPLPPLPKKGK